MCGEKWTGGMARKCNYNRYIRLLQSLKQVWVHRVDSSCTRLPRTILSGRVQRHYVIASYDVLMYWALCIDVWHQTGAHVGHAASREQSPFPHQKTDAELKNAPGNPFWSFLGCLVEVIHSYWHTKHANLPVTFSLTFIVDKFHYSQHWLCVFCIIPHWYRNGPYNHMWYYQNNITWIWISNNMSKKR